jgi:hypothetical protein
VKISSLDCPRIGRTVDLTTRAEPNVAERGARAKQRHRSGEACGRQDDCTGRGERSPSPRAIAKDYLRARCRGSASESDRPPREGRSENARLADLERRVEEIRPSIFRAIEKRFGGHILNNPETRQRTTEHPATSCTTTAAEKPSTPSPKKQEEEEWKVVTSKRVRRKEAKERMATDVRETAKKGGRTAAPRPPARRQPTQQPQKRTTGLPKPSSGAAAMKRGPSPASRMATLPRIQRTSAVTLTLSEGAKTKTSYAEIIATARRSIPLTEIGVKSIGMRKAVAGTIIIKVPGDKGSEKALQLATHLTKVLDPTAVKVAAASGRRT